MKNVSSVTTTKASYYTFLCTLTYKSVNLLVVKLEQRHVDALKFTGMGFTVVFYAVEQNLKMSLGSLNHRPLFRHLTRSIHFSHFTLTLILTIT